MRPLSLARSDRHRHSIVATDRDIHSASWRRIAHRMQHHHKRAAVGFVAGWEKGEKVWGFEMTS